MKTKLPWILVGILLLGFIIMFIMNESNLAENNRIKSELQLKILDLEEAQGRYAAETHKISNENIQSKVVKEDMFKRNSTPVIYVRGEARIREVIVEVPAEQEGEFFEEYSGSWNADTSWVNVSFLLDKGYGSFNLVRKPLEVTIETIVDDDGVVYLASSEDWLIIDNVTGLIVPQEKLWSVGAEVQYPLAIMGTIGYDYLRGEIGWDIERDTLSVGLGFEIDF